MDVLIFIGYVLGAALIVGLIALLIKISIDYHRELIFRFDFDFMKGGIWLTAIVWGLVIYSGFENFTGENAIVALVIGGVSLLSLFIYNIYKIGGFNGFSVTLIQLIIGGVIAVLFVIVIMILSMIFSGSDEKKYKQGNR